MAGTGLQSRMMIAGLGTAVPPCRYTQTQCWDALQQSGRFDQLSSRSQAILRKVLTGRNGILTRHLALDNLADAFNLTPDALGRRFTQHGPALASEAARRALADSGASPGVVDAVLISTCTGYLCPGLTSYVIEQLDLPRSVIALDLVGQGCGAAVPNLRVAEALLSSGRCRLVLSVCVEVCSAAFYLDDDPGVLVSACLFGDGAGSAVLTNSSPDRAQRLTWCGSSSLHDPDCRDALRFEQKGGMLRNILSPGVPRLAAERSAVVLEQGLAISGIGREAVSGWIFHPGGRDVLTALKEHLCLTDNDLRWSAGVLERYGNLSSASLFFVLQQALQDSATPGYWWMGTFGAGFTAHGALWRAL